MRCYNSTSYASSKPMRRIYILALLAVSLTLGACSNLGQAVLDVGRVAWQAGREQSFANIPLDPRYVYLEVHAPKASALMVLAYAEGKPEIETWMSASRELLRTEHGRFRGAQGVAGLWADVLWDDVPLTNAQLTHDAAPAANNHATPQTSVAVRDTALGIYTAPTPCQPLAAQPPKNPSPLLRRVLAASGPLHWQACQANMPGLPTVYSIVASVPKPAPGQWVYGQHCVGGQTLRSHCVEYWRRFVVAGT